MDLKALGVALSEALALRGVVDSLDSKIVKIEAQIKENRGEISRLNQLEVVTKKAETDRDELIAERGARQSDLEKRLIQLDEVGVKLPLQNPFGARQVSL